MPTTSPCATIEGDRLKPSRRGKVAQFQQWTSHHRSIDDARAFALLRLAFKRNNLLADNRFGDLVFVQISRVGSQHGLAVTKHRDLVGECHHFVEEVRDEQDCLVFAFGQAPHSRIDQFTLFGASEAVGSSMTIKSAPVPSSLQNRNHLPLTDRQGANQRIRIQPVADALTQFVELHTG